MAFKIRSESALKLAGLPLWSVAIGADPAKGEKRGHAKGIVALGDMATGVFAAGGLARGVVAFGGLAIGLASFGGLGIGLVLALGGAAAGGVAIDQPAGERRRRMKVGQELSRRRRETLHVG